MELPTKPIKATRKNPGHLILYGQPKCGKTTIAADLTTKPEFGKWLLLSLEPKGGDYVDAVQISVPDLCSKEGITPLQAIKVIGEEIIKQGKPYDGIIIDTVTKLEEMSNSLACTLYRNSPMGAAWVGTDVKTLPQGSGYLYLRKAYFQLSEYIETWATNVISIGHLSAKLVNKDGEEGSSKELDLTGKLSSLVCSKADAIAYVYREDEKTMLNFTNSEGLVCGSRCAHLRGESIEIASSDSDDNITTYWDRIYLK